MPHFLSILALGYLVVATNAEADPLLVVDVQTQGNTRYSTSAIVAASGLAVGQNVEDKDISAAVQRLSNTGMFSSVAWGYEAKTSSGKSGIAITFEIEEAPLALSVTFDIADVDEQELWREVKRENGLIESQMPASQVAQRYYLSAVKTALKNLNHDEDVVFKNEVAEHTGKFTVSYQSANLPQIAGITFEGNRLIRSDVLTAALKQASFFGSGYTEHRVRRLLEADVKPLYEERGHLTVAFPTISMKRTAQGVTVTASVEEGPQWTLGKVELVPASSSMEEVRKAAKFPEGKLADGKQIQAGLDYVADILTRNGYLENDVQSIRSYHQDANVVDLTVTVVEGKQTLFGSLVLTGFAPADMATAKEMWKLAEGAPLDLPYFKDYVKAINRRFPGIRFTTKLKHRTGGSNIVDPELTIN